MCIVVDANAAHQLNSNDPAGVLVLRWLLKGRGKIVVSKELLAELSRTHLRSTLVGLERAGRMLRANEEICGPLTAKLRAEGALQSNDAHVVALVASTSCDVVFTHDQPLHRDLKNRALVNHDCAIFQDVSHNHLLGECRC